MECEGLDREKENKIKGGNEPELNLRYRSHCDRLSHNVGSSSETVEEMRGLLTLPSGYVEDLIWECAQRTCRISQRITS